MGKVGGPLGLIRETLELLGAIVKGSRSRRSLMFVVCPGTMALVALGAFPMSSWLEEHPVFFLCHWGLIFLMVVLLMMLALYDILRLLSRR